MDEIFSCSSKQPGVNVEPCHSVPRFSCTIYLHTGGGGISQMGQQGWSGAGQRDYHYSLYNKRKFEEV